MFEILNETKADLLAIKASGTLTAQDYEQTLLPKLEQLFERNDRLKLFVQFSDDFAGWASTAAAWDDMQIGLEHANDFEKFAIVGGPQWVGIGAKLFSMFVHGQIKLFPQEAKSSAISWLHEKSGD